MDIIFQSIYDFLNNLLPDAVITDFGDMNKIIAYLMTLAIVWFAIVRPITRLFKK